MLKKCCYPEPEAGSRSQSQSRYPEPEPVKIGPAPQHCISATFYLILSFSGPEAGSIIGRGGEVVNSIRDESR